MPETFEEFGDFCSFFGAVPKLDVAGLESRLPLCSQDLLKSRVRPAARFPPAYPKVESPMVNDVLARYRRFARQHHRNDRRLTGEIANLRYAARPLKKVCAGMRCLRNLGRWRSRPSAVQRRRLAHSAFLMPFVVARSC